MADRFRDVFNTVEAHVERRYGLPVVITDVPDPFTGDLDGATILVDHDLDPEEALFILVHLFGHTVQWNVSPRDRELGLLEVRDPSEDLLAALARYEEDAARYSLQLFHDAGVHDLDQWLADFAACDIAYLLHFYRTGEKRAFRSFWRGQAPALTPLEIPPFRPTKWVARSGTVIQNRCDPSEHVVGPRVHDLTVRENIEFYADLYGLPRTARAARLERLYAFSQLGQFERRLAAALSPASA